MKEQLINLIEEKSPGSLPLYLVIRGSHAYGTNLPESDVDYTGVFIQSQDSIYGMSYVEQINDDKNDIVIYEIKRFLELLYSNNPNILEILNTPEDCVIYKHPIFDEILNNSDKFITKQCANSFGGYAKTQVSKAKGQNKKQNWERERVTRKDILDFTYVIEGDKSIPWKIWNMTEGPNSVGLSHFFSNGEKYDEKFCGVVNVQNARDVYAVFYDKVAHNCFSEMVPEKDRNEIKKMIENINSGFGLGFKGIVKSEEGLSVSESNQLRLSSIPKGMTPICMITYNKDGYTQHCKEWSSYQKWLEERNEARWIDVKDHNQMIDGKNMMHCVRLMQMADEISEGKGIIVRRPNFGELIDIRKGKVDLQTLIDRVETKMIEIDKKFKNSTLPDFIDKKFIESILIKIRKEIYK
jgi:predicted nucleotidyltransferase